MKNLKRNAAFALVLTVGALLPSAFAHAKKCKGVSTKWVNTCDSPAYGGHDCAGRAEGDFHPDEWLKFSDKDCDAIQSALKNEDVKGYIVSMRDAVVASSDAKSLKKFSCEKGAPCSAAKKIVKSKSMKKYIKKIAKGSLSAKKRGKKF